MSARRSRPLAWALGSVVLGALGLTLALRGDGDDRAPALADTTTSAPESTPEPWLSARSDASQIHVTTTNVSDSPVEYWPYADVYRDGALVGRFQLFPDGRRETFTPGLTRVRDAVSMPLRAGQSVVVSVAIPDEMPPGQYELHGAVFDPRTGEPVEELRAALDL